MSYFKLVLAAGLLVATGCSEPVGRIAGRVTYRGEPLTAGTVAFHTADGQVESSMIQPDGTYTVPAVPLGEVRVTVHTAENATPPPAALIEAAKLDGDAGELARQDLALHRPTSAALPARYEDPKTSGLVLTIGAGENPDYTLVLVP